MHRALYGVRCKCYNCEWVSGDYNPHSSYQNSTKTFDIVIGSKCGSIFILCFFVSSAFISLSLKYIGSIFLSMKNPKHSSEPSLSTTYQALFVPVSSIFINAVISRTFLLSVSPSCGNFLSVTSFKLLIIYPPFVNLLPFQAVFIVPLIMFSRT